MLYKYIAGLSVFCFLAACSDDSSTSATILEDLSGEISSSSQITNLSSSQKQDANTDKPSSSSSRKQETVYDTLMVKDSTSGNSPYYSEDSSAFNWDVPMVVESSSAAASSSSAKPTTVSSSSNAKSSSSAANEPPISVPPTLSGDSLTDNRDGNTYKLTMVGTTIWMAENINYETSVGSTCYNGDDCSKGALYTYDALTSVCPTGWRLPTREEFEAASVNEEFPWTFAGRMKSDSYAYQGDMGFFWLQKGSTFVDGDTDNCSGDACGMIFVKKAPDYGEGEFLFQKDSQDKGFSVRCVQN